MVACMPSPQTRFPLGPLAQRGKFSVDFTNVRNGIHFDKFLRYFVAIVLA